MKGNNNALLRMWKVISVFLSNTVEFQWLEHLWNHENMFETVVVVVFIMAPGQEA